MEVMCSFRVSVGLLLLRDALYDVACDLALVMPSQSSFTPLSNAWQRRQRGTLHPNYGSVSSSAGSSAGGQLLLSL